MTEQPRAPRVRFDALPALLVVALRWVLWRYTWVPAREEWAKVPYRVGGGKAKSTDPATWAPFDAARSAYEASLETAAPFSGVGFVVTSEDGIVGVDLDGCLDADGELMPWAENVLARLPATYTEVSPSGTGVRLFFRGTLPEGVRNKVNLEGFVPSVPGPKRPELEWYTSRRYLTLTGRVYGDAPGSVAEVGAEDLLAVWAFVTGLTATEDEEPRPEPRPAVELPETDAELLNHARRSRTGGEFAALYDRGDTGAYGGDDSRATAALLFRLAFWTGGDAARMDRLFRASALMRPKWDSRRGDSTWGALEIEHAIRKVSEHYAGTRSERHAAERNRTAAREAVEAAVASGGLGVVLSGVKRERVRWLWKGRLAEGKLTILDGDPGTGKSVFYIDAAARVTTGAAWPDEEVPPPGREPAGVVVVMTEDGIADTIAPRAAVAGADLTRVSVVQLIPEADGPGRVPVLPDDVELVMGECRRIGARLLVIDPLMAHLGGETNSYKDADVRRALAPLAEAAGRYGVAVLVVRHLNKAPGGNPLYRGGGSIGIIGAARIGLMLGRDPDREDRLALACTKINVGAAPGSLSLAVQPSPEDPDLPVIEWFGRSSLTARDLCANPDRGESKTEAAEAWLVELLAGGPRPSAEVFSEGEAAGHSKRTLYRAKDALGIEAKKLGFGGGWEWVLPEGLSARRSPKAASSTGGSLRGSWQPSAAGDGVPGEADTLNLTVPTREPWDDEDLF